MENKSKHYLLGLSGEALAVEYLKNKRYKIKKVNFNSPFGEIDIIAIYKKIICFIEVKTRSSTAFGLPSEAVTNKKQKHIIKTSQYYLSSVDQLYKEYRFDIIDIILDKKNKSYKLEHIKDAFIVEDY